MTFCFDAQCEEDTISFAARIATAMRPGDVITISGELGAGKTRFVRGLVRGLGLDERAVNSPTFVLMQEYEAPTADVFPLVHVDAYRITGPDDLATIGWADVIAEAGAVVAVEWPERIGEADLPVNRVHVVIDLDAVDENVRHITVVPRGNLCGREWAIVEGS